MNKFEIGDNVADIDGMYLGQVAAYRRMPTYAGDYTAYTIKVRIHGRRYFVEAKEIDIQLYRKSNDLGEKITKPFDDINKLWEKVIDLEGSGNEYDISELQYRLDKLENFVNAVNKRDQYTITTYTDKFEELEEKIKDVESNLRNQAGSVSKSAFHIPYIQKRLSAVEKKLDNI